MRQDKVGRVQDLLRTCSEPAWREADNSRITGIHHIAPAGPPLPRPPDNVSALHCIQANMTNDAVVGPTSHRTQLVTAGAGIWAPGGPAEAESTAQAQSNPHRHRDRRADIGWTSSQLRGETSGRTRALALTCTGRHQHRAAGRRVDRPCAGTVGVNSVPRPPRRSPGRPAPAARRGMQTTLHLRLASAHFSPGPAYPEI
jgi:hypothetical protein